MKSTTKLTPFQIQKMYEYIKKYSDEKSENKKVSLLFNPRTPKDIYVSYLSYDLLDDNSVSSQVELICIKEDGSVVDFANKFDNLNQRLEFESQLLEVDLDANAKIVIL